ncbi:MAG: type II toxin-antitoxin system RelE family toxin [Dermatophilaceae bacterium]
MQCRTRNCWTPWKGSRTSPRSTRRWPRRDPTCPGSRSRLTSVGSSPLPDRARPAALPALRQGRPADRERIRGAIALLASDPRPPASRHLKERSVRRVSVADYGIIYTIQDDLQLTVGHRRELYDR